MKRYCLVNELKEDKVQDYVDIHMNAHKSKWVSHVQSLRDSGMEECVVYIYKNYSILLIECEDLEESFNKLGENEASQKWNEVVLPMFAGTPKFDGSEKQEPCKKIFDLKQQLEKGKLEQY